MKEQPGRVWSQENASILIVIKTIEGALSTIGQLNENNLIFIHDLESFRYDVKKIVENRIIFSSLIPVKEGKKSRFIS